MLQALAARDDLDVSVVSGRDLGFLREHLGGLGFTLVAEHGHASCGPDGRTRLLPFGAGAGGGAGPDPGWMPAVAAAMERLARETPGARVERKAAGLVWHFRCVEPTLGERQAECLARELEAATAGRPLAVTRGHGIVEVTAAGVHKGLAISRCLDAAGAAGEPHAAVLCVGDDRTDEAMFRALEARAGGGALVSVKVGPGETAARFRVAGVGAVLALLRGVAGEPAAAASVAAGRGRPAAAGRSPHAGCGLASAAAAGSSTHGRPGLGPGRRGTRRRLPPQRR